MVAPFRCIHTDEIIGIHRTALTPDAKKIGRKMLGTASRAAIKLDPDAEVTMGLAVAEGVESGMAASTTRPPACVGFGQRRRHQAVAGAPGHRGIDSDTLRHSSIEKTS